MKVPLPSDSVLDRYRASICVDHGDWDGLQRYLGADLVEAIDWLESGTSSSRRSTAESRRPQLQRTIESSSNCTTASSAAVGRFKRWARSMPAFYPRSSGA